MTLGYEPQASGGVVCTLLVTDRVVPKVFTDASSLGGGYVLYTASLGQFLWEEAENAYLLPQPTA
jgi:hypothetical protein